MKTFCGHMRSYFGHSFDILWCSWWSFRYLLWKKSLSSYNCLPEICYLATKSSLVNLFFGYSRDVWWDRPWTRSIRVSGHVSAWNTIECSWSRNILIKMIAICIAIECGFWNSENQCQCLDFHVFIESLRFESLENR